MKKLLVLTASVLVAAAMPAMAEDAVTSATATGAPVKKEAPRGGDHVRRDFLETIDTNKDGNITKAEFLAHSETTFKNLDTDGNDVVSKAEIDAKREEWKQKMNDFRKERKAKIEASRAAKEKKAAETPAAAPATQDKPVTDAAPQ